MTSQWKKRLGSLGVAIATISIILFAALSSDVGRPASAKVDSAAPQTGTCGCMDVVLVVDDTGSMGPAIANVKAGLGDIVTAAQTASGGDLRIGVVSFKDTVEVDQPLTNVITDVTNAINALFASGGGFEPEASDEAVKYSATGASACAVSEPKGPLGAFRSTCLKIVVLVTDARPAGCDDAYADGVDDANAASAALAAAGAGIKISAVLVDNGSIASPAHPGGVEPDVMASYASTTGGVSTTVPADGTGTGAAIQAIIEACGSGRNECPLSQGFWKTHSEAWPVNSLTLGSQNYSQAELLALLEAPVQGDASLILAKQLIAAKLNIANGSNPAPVSGTITDADALLSGFVGKLPYGVKPSSSVGHSMTADAGVLDSYNNRALTPDCR